MQISSLNINANKYAILLQIILFSWIIRTIFIPTKGFFGTDPYKEVEVVKSIFENGWSLDSETFDKYKYQYSYPILYVLIIIGSQVLGINIDAIARWFPLLYSTFSLLFFYLFSNQLFKSEKSALISVFGLSLLYQYVMFHTLPVRESIAFVFFTICLYLYLSEKNSSVVFRTLMLFFIIMITLSHHLTSLLIIIFLFLHFINENICKILQNTRFNELCFIPNGKRFNIIVYSFVLVIGYWLYLRYSPLTIIAYAFQESAYKDPGHGMILPNTLRFFLLVNGEYIFSLLFSILSVYSLLISQNRKSINLTLIFWAALMGIMSILSLEGMVLKSESVAFASRFQSFGYISLFTLSGSIIGLNNHENRINMLIKLVYFLFIMFALFSIYRIPVNLYT